MDPEISFLFLEDSPTYAQVNRHNKRATKNNQGK